MPGPKRPRTHADHFADLEYQAAIDFDPEDDAANFSSGDDDASDFDTSNVEDLNSGRQHYERVGKSSLRQLESDALGPQYSGSRISRERAAELEDEHDPFVGQYENDDSESDDVIQGGVSDGEDGSSVEDANGNSQQGFDDDLDNNDIDDEDDHTAEPWNGASIDRTMLHKIADHSNKAMAARLSSANKEDVEKGRAVKRQRRTYDSLLNTRIRLQQGLIAINSLQCSADESSGGTVTLSEHPETKAAYEAAEEAALTLWNNLERLRQTVSTSKSSTASQPATAATTLDTIWTRMTTLERQAKAQRSSILSKWSQKTAYQAQQITTTAQHRLNPAANVRPPTIIEILETQHLSQANIDRLVQKTRIPRSCAPLQVAACITESAAIYDDADFYGQLLKELLESRNVDTSSTVVDDSATFFAEQAYRLAQKGAKMKGNVDTKASKGRKLRYIVHERLQNFMAPESRGSWGNRQIDELFSSLLGQRLAVKEGDEAVLGDHEDVSEEALRLFRN